MIPPSYQVHVGGDGLKHRCSYLKKILNMKLSHMKLTHMKLSYMKLLHLIFYVCTLVLRARLGFK